MAQFSGAASALGAAGKANQPNKGGGGGYGILGFKATGKPPYGSGGGKTSGQRAGGRSAEAIKLGTGKGKGRPGMNVFEKASRGLPLDDDELAQLSPEQAALWQSLRADNLYGTSA